MCEDEMMELAEEFQEGFYKYEGDHGRETLKAEYVSNRRAVRLYLETFVVLIRTNKLSV